MKSAISAFAWICLSITVSELLGYLLHRLMHSGKIGFVSRSHMKHHLLLYGPLEPQRPGSEYKDATGGEVAIGNVGPEWLVPGAAILGMAILLMSLLRVRFVHQAIFVTVALVWSFLMFSYLHDCMHIADFWMERNRWLKTWFLSARQAHDIHHWSLNKRGFMDKNFGIGFFVFDHCFGTFTTSWPHFNQQGYEAAKRRFGDLLKGASNTEQHDAGSVRMTCGDASSDFTIEEQPASALF